MLSQPNLIKKACSSLSPAFARFFAKDTRTEKEKMLNEEFYLSGDEELTNERTQTRLIVDEYNLTKADEFAKRKELLDKLFRADTNVYIEPPFRVDYGHHIHIGREVYMNYNCIVLDVAEVWIGDRTMFGPNVGVYTATHPTDPDLRLDLKEYGKRIRIGDNCWIGGNAVICPGVTIGDNSIVAAGAVVTHDVPPNCVAAGNPARVIKHLKPPTIDVKMIV